MGTLKEIEGRYFKECSAVILPTEYKTNIGIRNIPHNPKANGLSYSKEMSSSKIYWQPQHLYITSDDEIKEGDYVLYNQKEILQVQMVTSESYHFTNGEYEMKTNIFLLVKIIATTDKSLSIFVEKIKYLGDVVKPFPSPSQAFIKKYCELGGIDKVLVEYEPDEIASKMSQAKNWQKKFQPIFKLKTDSHNTITINSVKNNWNRDELTNLLLRYSKEQFGTISNSKYVLDWIKENL